MRKRSQTLDQLDLQLLKALAENPLESYAKVKDKVGVSIGTIYLRVQRLKEAGVIKGAQLLLDAKKLGYSLVAAARLHVPDLAKAIKALEGRPDVGTVHVLTGSMNLLVYAYLRDVNDLHGLLQFFAQELKSDRTEVEMVLDTPVSRGVPVPSTEAGAPARRRGPAAKGRSGGKK